MIKYTGLNINKEDNNNTAEYDEIYYVYLQLLFWMCCNM